VGSCAFPLVLDQDGSTTVPSSQIQQGKEQKGNNFTEMPQIGQAQAKEKCQDENRDTTAHVDGTYTPQPSQGRGEREGCHAPGISSLPGSCLETSMSSPW